LAVCGEYTKVYWEVELAASLVPMIFSLTLISAITKIVDGNNTLTFKSQVVKNTVQIITMLFLNSAMQLNSIFGSSFVENTWASSIAYFFWGWGCKHALS
jgi:hypothetical protein